MAGDKIAAFAWALASPFADALSQQAAHEVLAAADPNLLLNQLFPVLMGQKGLRAAFGHLQRAGADLNAFSIPTSLICNTFPMSRQRLWPVPPDTTWEFGRLAQVLTEHHQLLWQATTEMARRFGPHRFILLSGRAVESLFPDYNERLGFDTDLWVPRMSDGVDALELLVRELGYRLEYVRLHNIQSEPRLVASVVRHYDGYKVMTGILAGGYQLFREPLDQRACPVQWESQPLQAPSCEDLLVMLAARVQRKQQVQMVNVADVAFILRRAKALDVALVHQLSQKYGMELPLGILLAQAEARWPGTVPEQLSGVIHKVPRLHRTLTHQALQVGDDDPARQRERLAFEVAAHYHKRPAWGWSYATASLLSRKAGEWAGRWQGKIRNRLGRPVQRTSDLLYLCGATNGEAAALLPNCVAREPAARWGEAAGDEIRQTAERLIRLLPADNHLCWQLRASH